MPRHIKLYRLLSITNSVSLVLQQLMLPLWIAFTAAPVLADSPKVFSFVFDAPSNSFQATIPTKNTVSYGLYYVHDGDMTEAVKGSGQNNPVFSKDIKAATCSEGGTCVDHHDIKRGVFKWQSTDNTGAVSFLMLEGKASILNRYDSRDITIDSTEEAWLYGTDTAPPYSPIVTPEPTATPTPTPEPSFEPTPNDTVSPNLSINGTGSCILDITDKYNDLNCTSEDIELAGPHADVIDGCDSPNDYATFDLFVDVKNNAQDRYDVGVWISTDGDPNHDGSYSGECAVAKLPTISPGFDLDSDSCGDVSNTANTPDINGAYLGRYTLLCSDVDHNGQLDVPIVTSWSNSENGVCTTAQQTIPENKAKCKTKLDFNIPVPVPGQIIIKKETVPDASQQSFDFSLGGAINRTFSLKDGETWDSGTEISGGLAGGIYSVAESSTPNWNQTSAACVSSKGDTETARSLSLQAGETITCTFTNSLNKAKLTVTKVVNNDHGGTKIVSDFPLFVGNTSVVSGVKNEFDPGTYTVSETNQSGYTGAITGDCTANGSITLAAGDDKTCTITNNDNSAHLTLIKQIVQNNGGTASATDWTLTATGPTTISGTTGSTAVTNAAVNAGSYTLSENGPTGYDASNWSCSGGSLTGNVVTMGLNEAATCTITNDDRPASLTVIKHVINDNGGTKTASDFTLTITNSASPAPFNGSESGTTVAVNAGSYSVTENVVAGYTQTANNCTGTIAGGESKTCTITNNDIAPSLTLVKDVDNDFGGTAEPKDFTLTAAGLTGFFGPGPSVSSDSSFKAGTYLLYESGPTGYTPSEWVCTGTGTQNGNEITLNLGQAAICTIINKDRPGTLIVRKVVIKDNGGTLEADDFSFKVNDGTVIPFEADGQNELSVDAGTYTVTEPAVTGWATSYDNCRNVVIPNGGSATCTITNNDIQPQLTLVKTVTNNDGGEAVVSDFPLFVSGTPVTSGVSNGFNAGTYTASETQQFGYSAGNWDGDCAADGSVTLEVGDDKTCTITNSDTAPTLKLTKAVKNDNGGLKEAKDWTLTAQGSVLGFTDTGDSTTFHTVKAGVTYILSESGPTGYAADGWSCDGGQASGNTVKLDIGTKVTCTITNDDQPGTLIVKKVIVKDNGGNETYTDFGFRVNGGSAIGFEADGQNELTVVAGTYTVTEPAVAGWTTSYDNCTNVVIPNGGSATCTITNNDIAPTITLYKEVHGSETDIDSFGLTIGGVRVNSGETRTVAANTPIALDEEGMQGWSFTHIYGDKECPEVLGGTVTLGEGEHVSCTIVNTRDEGSITVYKIIDADGNLETTNDQAAGVNWQFEVNGVGGDTSNVFAYTNSAGSIIFSNLKTGRYSLTESIQDGYQMIKADCGVETGNFDEIDTFNDLRVSTFRPIVCTFYNSPNDSIVGYKWNDANGNGTLDVGEDRLAGWVITLEKLNSQEGYELLKSATTQAGTALGNYVFDHLFPGDYRICETQQTGWTQTYPGNNRCHMVRLPQESEQLYAFGNQQVTPRLTIEKFNNQWPKVLSPGNEIRYTIIIRAYDNSVYNVQVKDLLPLDIQYQAGSYQANSNLHGLLAIAPPTYASPGTWNLGTLAAGEIVTLTYTGVIKAGTDAGTYKDIAWAAGTVGTSTDTAQVMAASVPTDQSTDPGNITDTFVGTKILVDTSNQTSASIDVIQEETRGKVLGATTLPATGGHLGWILVSLGLIGTGAGLWAAGGKKRGKHA